MNPVILITIAVAVLVCVLVIALIFLGGAKKQGGSIEDLLKNQRGADIPLGQRPKVKVSVHGIHKTDGQQIQQKHYGEGEELERRLRCAGWAMMPITFRALQICSGMIVALIFFIFGFGLKILWLPFGFGFGLLAVNGVLSYQIGKRFKNFDNDYPNFLLSLCGLLKTGMNPMQAIEAAIEPLDDSSLLRQEVQLMIERLRFGVLEEASIGAFGENIDHPEIELFVQAIMLSRRLGGTLSDTLERLAKQVRKRQFFRGSAAAAISLQRGSVWVIMGILVGLIGYVLVIYPPLIVEGFKLPIGQILWQVGIMLMMIGVWWVRQVTKLRI